MRLMSNQGLAPTAHPQMPWGTVAGCSTLHCIFLYFETAIRGPKACGTALTDAFLRFVLFHPVSTTLPPTFGPLSFPFALCKCRLCISTSGAYLPI